MHRQHAKIVPGILLLVAAISDGQSFGDNFANGKLDTSKWTVATYKSPDSKPGLNDGAYAPESLDFSHGMLRISVEQQKSGNGMRSLGGAVVSKQRFGFGTYEFVMRMSSTSATPAGPGNTLTGAVSSGFLYSTNSESEIDLEFLGNENAIWITSWRNNNPQSPPADSTKQTNKISNHYLASQFRRYKLVWSKHDIRVFIDGTQVAHQTEHVPQTPAHIILQHRGTNGKWGGNASLGVARYFYVKSVSFTPEGGS